jgi:hypothetical protein
MSSEVDEDIYNTSNPCLGVAVIFNQMNFADAELETRHGSEKDEKDLTKVLEELGFDVRVFRDEKEGNIKEKLKKGKVSTQFVVICGILALVHPSRQLLYHCFHHNRLSVSASTISLDPLLDYIKSFFISIYI